MPARPDSSSSDIVLTQRVRRKKTPGGGTFSGMYVFPGGHVDLKANGESESLEEAAGREFQEETGLKILPESLKPVCSYQAGLGGGGGRNGRAYLIVFFEVDVDPSSVKSSLLETFKNVQRSEVKRICLLPSRYLKFFAPSSLDPAGAKTAKEELKGEDIVVKSVSVNDDGTMEVTEATVKEIFGIGGEGSGECGMGMGHRFAAYCLDNGGLKLLNNDKAK